MKTVELSKTDLHLVLSHTPKDIITLIKENGLFLAGGFIRATISGECPSDIDLLGPDKAKLEDIGYRLSGERNGRTYKTNNALTVIAPSRLPIQFILRWTYADPLELISRFDFTIVQTVIWWKDATWWSLCSDQFYPDLAAKRLTYTFPNREEEAGGSMLRMIKYIKRGYNIQPPSLAGVISRLIHKCEFEKCIDQEDESYVALIITGLLREVDPLLAIDGCEMMDEHEPIEESKEGE